MNQTIRILHLEDDPSDVKLIHATIAAAGIECQITSVQTRAAFEKALEGSDFDLVLADYILPNFDGITAMRIFHNRHPDIPFLFVSGTMGEDAAIEGLTGGAWDYVPKPKLYRLVPAIRRALQDAENRRERKLLEMTSERSRIELKAIHDHAPVMMSVIDANGFIQYANRAFVDFCRNPEPELKGRRIGDSLGCEFASECPAGCGFGSKCRFCPLEAAIRDSFKTNTNYRSVECPATLKRGNDLQKVVFRCSTALLHVNNQSSLLLCMEDISSQKLAEEERDRLRSEFLQAQKMEAYGRLASGVAHDFNNLLTIIINFCQLTMDSIPRDNPAFGYSEAIFKSAYRAADLTRHLLAFARKQIMQIRAIDLNAVILELNKMLKRIIGDHIEFHTELDQGIPPIMADPGQIGQVILNLVVNAQDAMPGGGRLTISTRRRMLDKVELPMGEILGGSIRDIVPGSYVCLSVKDTGEGISDEVKPRLIEPFFTTKAPGKGTGLGLPTVFGIAKQSHGHLLLETAVGRGSTFHLLFPEADSHVIQEPSTREATSTAGSGESILVVDDSEDLRLLACKILEVKGYNVLTASNGEEALHLAKTSLKPIHLLLVDVVMPGMTGPKLWKRILEVRPNLRVLFMSGLSPDDLSEIHPLQQAFPFLPKPFSGSELLKKLREILNTASWPSEKEVDSPPPKC